MNIDDALKRIGSTMTDSEILLEYLQEKAGQKAADTVIENIINKMNDYGLTFSLDAGAIIEVSNTKAFYIEDISESFCRMFGYTRKELLETRVLDFEDMIYKDDLPLLREKYDEFLGKGDHFILEYRMKKSDGSYLWVSNIGCIYMSGINHVITFSFITDITDFKKRREIIYQGSGRFFETLYDMLPSAVLQVMPRHDIFLITANKAFYKMVGYTRDEIMALFRNALSHIIFEDDYRKVQHIIKNMKQGDCIRGVLRVIHKSGQLRVLEIDVCRLVNEDGMDVVQVVGNDVTEKKSADSMQSVFDAEREQTDRLTGCYSSAYGIELIKRHMLRKKKNYNGILFMIYVVGMEKAADQYSMGFAFVILREIADLVRKIMPRDTILSRQGNCELLGFIKLCRREDMQRFFAFMEKHINHMYPFEKTGIQICLHAEAAPCGTMDEFLTLEEDYFIRLRLHKAAETSNELIFYDHRHDVSGFDSEAIDREYRYLFRTKMMAEHYKDAEDPVTFAIELLRKARDVKGAINIILEHTGRFFGLSRVFITEINMKHRYYEVSYEWPEQKDDRDEKFRYLTQEVCQTLQQLSDTAVFKSDRLLFGTMQKASYLSSAIVERGEFKGFLTFCKDAEKESFSAVSENTAERLAQVVGARMVSLQVDTISGIRKEFVSRISHEVRTPLNAIYGMSLIAHKMIGDEKKVLECLKIIEDSSNYLMLLMSDLLDYSSIEDGKIAVKEESFRLKSISGKALMLLENLSYEQGITYRLEKRFKDSELLGDEMRVNQVLAAIINNSCHRVKGGTVSLTITETSIENGMHNIRFSVKESGNKSQLTENENLYKNLDHGDAELLLKFGGTGLTLSIISRLVQLMGGKLKVRTRKNLDSEIYFTLCFAEQNIRQTDSKEALFTNMRKLFTGKHILIVEDNELNLEITKVMLENNGAMTDSAENGEIALKQYSSKEPYYYDAILMDMRMPVMDGMEATRLIRRMNRPDAKSIPIVAVTADSVMKKEKNDIGTEINGHIAKPVEYQRIYEVMSQLIS